MSITIGHDSEFGLRRDGAILSALDHLTPFETLSGRGFPDNMNAEIAINPVKSLKDFHAYTDDLISQVQEQNFDVVLSPTIKYPDEAMQNPLAYISGCNPDFCAYTGMENNAPDFKTMDSTRSAGGHIHVGVEGLNKEEWVMWMDLFVGLPLLSREPLNDRRKLYGGPGAYRDKPYGAEYRTLSNIWIQDPELREFVYEGTMKAVEKAQSSSFRDSVPQWERVPSAIATHDINLASQVIDQAYIFGVQNVN